MSTYICDKCGCVDNTGCGGNYWSVVTHQNSFSDEYSNTHLLCCECTPNTFVDGSKNTEAGKWHNRFPKRHWSKIGSKSMIIAESKKDQGSFVNAVEYFKNHPEE
jgi:hypothetical protein